MKAPIVKKRKIALRRKGPPAELARIEKRLMERDGMISVSGDNRKNVLVVEYDLRRIGFEEIERFLRELGLELSRTFLERWKRGMAKFTEQNERDNLKAPISSCCHDPKGTGQEPKGCAAGEKNFQAR